MTSKAKPEWKPVQTPGTKEVRLQPRVIVRKVWKCDACGGTIPKGTECQRHEYHEMLALRFHKDCIPDGKIWIKE